MKIKIIVIFVCILLLLTIVPINVMAGSEEDPEIEDETGDAFGYIDIESVWFYEKQEEPDILYISMKIFNSSETRFQQTFAVFWSFKNIKYAVSLHLGFSFDEWMQFNSGIYRRKSYSRINGTYDFYTGVITWKIPKTNIGNPEKNDILTDTWSNAFRRLGFIGRIGFTRYILDSIIFRIFGNNMWDYAPDKGTYGRNYTIKY